MNTSERPSFPVNLTFQIWINCAGEPSNVVVEEAFLKKQAELLTPQAVSDDTYCERPVGNWLDW